MIEELLWGLIPALAATLATLASIGVTISARRPIHYLVSAIVLALSAWSLVILYRIFIAGAWPTFLPHITIGLSAVITSLQFAYRKTR